MTSRLTGALGERQFRLLWTGQAISAFGDRLFPVAVSFAALDLTHGDASAVGEVLAVGTVVQATFTLIGGTWADRLSRRRVMLASDLVRALVQAVGMVLLLGGVARVWQLAALYGVYGLAAAFFSPASTGLVPETISRERLQDANALMSLSRNAIGIIGPVSGGLIIAAGGPGVTYGVDALTFLGSALCLARMAISPRKVQRPGSSLLRETAEGWQEFRRRRWVWLSVLYFGVINVAVSMFFVLGPLVCRQSLGGPVAWGLILTGGAAGFLVGGAIALRIRPRRPLLAGYLTYAVTALEFVLLAARAPVPALAAANLLATAALAITNALWLTTLQTHIPADRLSRVSAYDWLGSLVTQPLGYSIAGPLAALAGTGPVLVGAGCCVLVASLAVAVVPDVRRCTPQPEPETVRE